jgi:hypothetical protein
MHLFPYIFCIYLANSLLIELSKVAGWTARGRFLCILEGSASVARDCKRDIYFRFLYTSLLITLSFLYIIVIYIYTFNWLLLHLIIVYPLLVCILLLLYVYICVCFLLYCLVSLYRSCRAFSSGWGPPPYSKQPGGPRSSN